MFFLQGLGQYVPCVTKDNNAVPVNESPKPPDKLSTTKSDIKTAEVAALNMELETLRWQLGQVFFCYI